MAYQYIELDIADDVATIRFNRPPGNLLNIDMIEEINHAVLSLHRRKQLEVLVLRGGDDCFSQGFDLNDLVPERTQRLLHVHMRLFEILRMVEVVQIAVVRGAAVGAGFEVALGCNLFLASEDAWFELPETGIGIFPPIASVILPRIAPRRKAMEWILTGNRVTAAELSHHGVINRLLPADGFDDAISAFIRDITSKSGPVLELARRAQMESYYSTFPEAVSRSQSLFLRDLMELQDTQEGLRARRDQREAKWINE